jgi:RHS repeat-associated protein
VGGRLHSYDADHRLTQVDNTLFNPYETKDAFSASYSYDPAGNLISLKRNGWRDAVQDYVLIDDISYAYSGNNSVLTSVQEQTGLPEGLAASSHYSYDLNGNLIGDTGKGITQIDYNLLNLPVKVIGQGGGILEFEYTFGGEKIRKNNEYEREYVGGLEYKNNVLELIHFPNGRIDKTAAVDTFQYYLTDHLGNIVVLFQDTDGDGVIALEEETNGAMDEVIQRNYYYSFGLRVDSPDFQIGDEPKNNYLYNGKELNEELDLNWLAYGFRWYDPAVGRFPSVDPAADQFAWVSPFNYAENEPIAHIDLWGLQAYSIHGTNSDPSTFNSMSDDDIKNLTGNNSVNREFSWESKNGFDNSFFNDEADRGEAAEALATHVLGSLKDGEDITLVGHSHGGNVAIQAVDKIQAGLDEAGDGRSINLVTIATPAYNGANDVENPANTSADSHTHFYSMHDGVQTTGANLFGSKDAGRTYSNPRTTNIRVNDSNLNRSPDPLNPGMTRSSPLGPAEAHFIHTRPQLLKKND